MPSVVLKPGREKSLHRLHPWIFSGAIKSIEGSPHPGATIEVLSSRGEWLASGAYSPDSQIPIRIWTFDSAEAVSPSFFLMRIHRAIEARARLKIKERCSAFRLIYAESDGIPGLIADQYGEFLVCQFLSAGVEFQKDLIVRAFREILPLKGIFERSDADVRRKEGLPLTTGILSGEPPPELIEIHEDGIRFLVDVYKGHKTGFYLDQRDSRSKAAAWGNGCDVLNVFSYTGGFGIGCLKAGAHRVIHIDSSKTALELIHRHVELNDLNPEKSICLGGDAFQVLRKFRDENHRFDLIILDPPKFIESKSRIEKGARGYKDINMLAIQLLNPYGILFTYSCSGHMESGLFQKIVSDAALDAGREAQVIFRFSQPADHPVALNFPESSYLKGLMLRVF
ncbi:MAG: class I SAM-dependent methyltransferase [Thermodesulfobacteriota bacterium]